MSDALRFHVEVAFGDLLRAASDEQLRAECLRRGIGALREVPALTGGQVRAARGLLDWPQPRLARASGVSVSTIKRIEEEAPFETRPGKAEAIRRALQDGGVHFVGLGAATGVLRAPRGDLRALRGERAADAPGSPSPPSH